jgi:hypothetical protein
MNMKWTAMTLSLASALFAGLLSLGLFWLWSQAISVAGVQAAAAATVAFTFARGVFWWADRRRWLPASRRRILAMGLTWGILGYVFCSTATAMLTFTIGTNSCRADGIVNCLLNALRLGVAAPFVLAVASFGMLPLVTACFGVAIISLRARSAARRPL